jgi:hypothetical protein
MEKPARQDFVTMPDTDQGASDSVSITGTRPACAAGDFRHRDSQGWDMARSID